MAGLARWSAGSRRARGASGKLVRRLFDAGFYYLLVSALTLAGVYGYVSTPESFGHPWYDDLVPYAIGAGAWAVLLAVVWAFQRRRTNDGCKARANNGFRARALRDLPWPEVKIGADTITVLSYPFEHASFGRGPAVIVASRITSLFSSSDAAFVLDGREIVFVPRALKDELQRFAVANGIASPKIREVWAVLAEPCLDQEYTSADEARDDKWFLTAGFAAEEVRRLRAEIRPALLAATFLTMEWVEYTTQDTMRVFALLVRTPPTADFYWHVMEVALRPYGRSG
jgi:hypothetical protein